MADAVANLAYSTIATAPSPATSGTSFVVAAGEGALFPAAPFMAIVWPASTTQLWSNAEIVRVTAVATDTFTITRTSETTSGARTIVVGDQIEQAFTKQMYLDLLPLTAGTTSPVTGILDVQASLRVKGPGPFVDVMSGGFTRKCAGSLTTTLGTITSGTKNLTLTSATGWTVGMGVWLVLDGGASVFTSYITALVGTAATLFDNASGTASGTGTNVCGHDDTLAIQDAIDFASASGKVFIPGGSYYISNIKLRAGVALEGAGMSSTLLVSMPGNTASGMVTLFSTSTNNARLRDLQLSGNKSASPAPTCAGVYLNNSGLVSRQHQLSNIKIVNTAGDAIKLTSVLYAHFTDIIIDTPDGHGIVDDAGSFFNIYLNVAITSPGLNGVHFLGDASQVANLFATTAGRITPTAPYGANIYIGAGSHGHTFVGFWVSEGALANINIDAVAGGSMNMTGTTHQNNAAKHLLITGATDCNIKLTAVPGVSQAATSLLDASGACVRNYVEIIYNLTTVAANTPPATGAGLSGVDNFFRITNGSKFGSGDINVFDAEPLYVSQDWTRNSPTTLWRYPGSMVYRQPG